MSNATGEQRRIGWWVALAALGMALGISCAGTRTGPPRTAEEKFRDATARFDKRNYEEARVLFESVIFENPGSVVADSAQYLVGMCYYRQQEYELAGGEFQRFSTQYPTSELVDDAELMRVRCFFYGAPKNTGLDQHYTETCVNLTQTFKDDHPSSDLLIAADSLLAGCWERLSRRDYSAGRLYYRMGAYQAAQVYFQLVLDRFPQSPFVPQTLYLIGESYRRREVYDTALVWYEKLIYLYPETAVTDKARKRVTKIRPLLPSSPPAALDETR